LESTRHPATTVGEMKLEMSNTKRSDDVIEALILDLLEWLANGERTYEQVMEAWRTSCPRLTVWEDANDRGLIATEQVTGRRLIRPSSSGLALLDQRTRHQRSEAHPAKPR
jgi:hypothetical protein